MKPLRVMYVGNFEPDYSTENDVRRAFEYLGWTVMKVQEQTFLDAAQAGTASWQLLHDAVGMNDLVLHTLTQGSYPEDAVLGMWERCREVGVPTASFHLDKFYGLASPKHSAIQRCDLPRLHPMFKVDHVFTADGDSDELFKADGVNHHWLPPAVSHSEAEDLRPFNDGEGWPTVDVGFVGARGYHPEHDRAGLVDALAERYGSRFTRVAGDTQWGTYRGPKLNRLYATVPVFAGDSCFAGTATRYFSDRFFETWGRGGFLVFPRIQGLVDLVGPYPCWAPYEDRDAMFDMIDYWLAHPEDREALRRSIAERIRGEHTYVNRVQEMLDVMGLSRG